ncbi:MAG: DUF5336 domain-containing protein [Jatrophihabitans sp.]|uniref:DUF5336 domain-containing protein n=1 Tax=Jatrophihabitans sp. TaxID=1932789 RepID=UPI003910CFCB
MTSQVSDTRGAASRGSADASKKERTLSMIAGVLGVLMFLFGFLKWLSVQSGGHNQVKYSGYAMDTPTSAVILLSLAAGLIALFGAMDRRDGRGVPSAIPTGLALTSLLGAIAILLSKGSITDNVGAKVGAEIGLILGLITAALQTIVLGIGMASRKDDEAYTGGAAVVGDNTRRV